MIMPRKSRLAAYPYGCPPAELGAKAQGGYEYMQLPGSTIETDSTGIQTASYSSSQASASSAIMVPSLTNFSTAVDDHLRDGDGGPGWETVGEDTVAGEAPSLAAQLAAYGLPEIPAAAERSFHQARVSHSVASSSMQPGTPSKIPTANEDYQPGNGKKNQNGSLRGVLQKVGASRNAGDQDEYYQDGHSISSGFGEHPMVAFERASQAGYACYMGVDNSDCVWKVNLSSTGSAVSGSPAGKMSLLSKLRASSEDVRDWLSQSLTHVRRRQPNINRNSGRQSGKVKASSESYRKCRAMDAGRLERRSTSH